MDAGTRNAETVKRSIQHARILLLLVFFAVLGSGAQSNSTVAPVMLDGKTVITIRWAYGNYAPQMRAKNIASSLQSVAADQNIPLQVSR